MFGLSFNRWSFRRKKHDEILGNVEFTEKPTSPTRTSWTIDSSTNNNSNTRRQLNSVGHDPDAVKAYIEKTRIFVSPTPTTAGQIHIQADSIFTE